MTLSASVLAFWPHASAAQEQAEEPDATPHGYQELMERIEELEKQVEELKSQGEAAAEEAELEALLAAADKEIAAGEDEAGGEGAEVEGEIFQSGARALQGLNPEISVTADLLATLYMNRNFYVMEEVQQHAGHVHGGIQRSGLALRTFGVAFQSSLDPFSFLKFVFAFHNGNPGICEGYITWAGVIPRVTFMLGKFHQQFGVINRWHEHGLDQVDRPLTHKKYLGSHGLVGTGVSMKIMIPKAWAHAQEFTLQVTNGDNANLFAGEFFSIPTVLGHLKSFWDLSDAAYLELGLSAAWGLNNRWGWLDEDIEQLVNEGYRHTVISGADLSLVWLPPGRENYRGVAWRSEFLYLHKQEEHNGSIEEIDSFAGFTYIDVRTGAYVILGTRFEIGKIPNVGGKDWYWQASPYMTIWQSHFVYFRLQYNATWESGRQDPIHAAIFQTVFAAGPHKHEKY